MSQNLKISKEEFDNLPMPRTVEEFQAQLDLIFGASAKSRNTEGELKRAPLASVAGTLQVTFFPKLPQKAKVPNIHIGGIDEK